ncbi:MAG: hypothetical protein LQ346_007746 [Caloplaca aetnensis]|nr:MAG: hypothetical protein LQ346_007746 [Caloplaca aetnensis]
MAAVTQQRVRGRPAHPNGPTFLTYTPDGSKLITAGTNNVIRVYTTGSDGEPTNIDDCQDNNTALAATDDFFVAGAEDGSVCLYSLETNLYDRMLTRCTLPIRDIAISPDGKWAAVASDELEIKIVDTQDMIRLLRIRDLTKPPKHLSFHPSGSYLAVSCTDGIIYIYSISTEEPTLVKKFDGLIRRLESDDERSSRAIWHPDGRAFAIPTATREIQVISREDGEKQRAFSGGHMGDITALAWSPNGAMLATSASDRKIVVWDTKTQKTIARYEYSGVINFVWHPKENIFSFVTSEGELFIYPNFLSPENLKLLQQPLQPAPFIHDPLAEIPGNARKALTNGLKIHLDDRTRRKGTPDSLDDILGPQSGGEEDDFVEDDDGAGYLDNINGYGKRSNDHLFSLDGPNTKRRATYEVFQPPRHESFQPGSTPWRGNRRYLLYRQKSSPTVTCASWRDYVLTMGNGPVGGDGCTKLLYTIENVKRDEVCQSEDIVALTENAQIKSVFFSDTGDPCIYDSLGTLLILQHWRTPGQARWVPLVDTKMLERLAGGRKEETYWPVAVAQNKFHCIILKGGDQYPYFPKPLLSEFEFKIPCSTAVVEETSDGSASEGPRLEESFVRSSLMLSLLEDLVAATNASHGQRTELSRREMEVDKVLLQLLNVECREGEDRGMKALEIVGLMRDSTGKMLEAAGKVAGRYGRSVLQEKINDLAERRLMGMDDEDT